MSTFATTKCTGLVPECCTPTSSVLCCHFMEPPFSAGGDGRTRAPRQGLGSSPLSQAWQEIGSRVDFYPNRENHVSSDPKWEAEQHSKGSRARQPPCTGMCRAPQHRAARIPATSACPQSLLCFQDAPSSCRAPPQSLPESPSPCPARRAHRRPPITPCLPLPRVKAEGPMGPVGLTPQMEEGRVFWTCGVPIEISLISGGHCRGGAEKTMR